jgi:hypothetical protein
MVSGSSSNLLPVALLVIAFLVIFLFAYLKNRLLTTLELSHSLSKGDTIMEKAKHYFTLILASLFETIMAIGASNWASVGPLT